MDLQTAAITAVGTARTPAGRVQRLVAWLGENFAWTSPAGVRLTPPEILSQRRGSPMDHACLLAALLRQLRIPYRWVAEIYLLPPDPARQARAAALVAQEGLRCSAYGLMHDDQRWLEIDLGPAGWYPVDTSVGAFGLTSWVHARLSFERCPTAPLLPFALLGVDRDDYVEERQSAYYLVRAFDHAYEGRLSSLAAWGDWCGAVRAAEVLAAGVFTNRVNLHGHVPAMLALLDAYDALRAEALGLVPEPVIGHGLHG